MREAKNFAGILKRSRRFRVSCASYIFLACLREGPGDSVASSIPKGLPSLSSLLGYIHIGLPPASILASEAADVDGCRVVSGSQSRGRNLLARSAGT